MDSRRNGTVFTNALPPAIDDRVYGSRSKRSAGAAMPGSYPAHGAPLSSHAPGASGPPYAPLAQNGVSRTISHRRRQSEMPQAVPQDLDASPTLPAAFNTTPALDPAMSRSRGNRQSYPPPDDNQSMPRRSSTKDQRKGSLTGRSPLQTLESKLGDISKEEKRSRLQEAELIAEQRALAAEDNRRLSRGGSKMSPNARGVADAPIPATQQTQREVKQTSKPPEAYGGSSYVHPGDPIYERRRSAYRRDQERSSRSARRNSLPIDQPQPAAPQGIQPMARDRRSLPAGYSADEYPPMDNVDPRRAMPSTAALERSGSRKLQKDQNSGRPVRQPSNRNKSLPKLPKEVDSPRSPYINLDPPRNVDYGSSPVYTSTHRGSYAAPTKQYRVPDQLSEDPRGAVPSAAAAGALAAGALSTRSRPQNNDATRDTAQSRDVDQSRLDRQSRKLDQVLGTDRDAGTAEQTGTSGRYYQQHAAERPHPGSHRLSEFVHRRHEEDERRYKRPPGLEEWREGGVASLVGEDLLLDGPLPDKGADKGTPWWEQSPSQRRKSGAAGAPTGMENLNDGNLDEPTGQTTFKPPLHLKCGPLLRYVGMKRELSSRSTQEREIWRGSVLIVTDDANSSYSTIPVLRLFAQPMELLPPPPAQLDATSGHLAPEYVDPLAGQTTLSRTGKTLYVRPVENLEEATDLSRVEDNNGLFEETRSAPLTLDSAKAAAKGHQRKDGERLGKFRQVAGVRLHTERGVTFWRFNLQVELGSSQTRMAYRINGGPAVGFWVPARGDSMNIMFHSCNGFSLSVDPNNFSGPDPLWRDVLNNHQTRPFHVMLGGGDQIYNDAATRDTQHFGDWIASRNTHAKMNADFSEAMEDELEQFYLERYCMWFSQGLFSMATSQIPMVNIWDDHDIIDGFGSYPHHFMKSPVFSGVGSIAYKYYMLFQHQTVMSETQKDEPSWVLGAKPGPYINELSRSVFMSLGKKVAFLGLDCRTERMRDEVLTQETYDIIFDRLNKEIKKGETKHLLVLLGVPIAYPRLNFLENVLTSRAMDPIKALGRMGVLGNFVNKFDGGVEILDDLDDHWAAKHHKGERNWFIQELQYLAAAKSVRITILGGDVHLAAIGQFFSPAKMGVSKDRDHRYMPNVISSAIVNTPPPDMMADVLNKRNKIHHLDDMTDENMIPMFTHDVDGKPRNNKHLLPRRNWCALREYHPGTTPPSSRSSSRSPSPGRQPRSRERSPGGAPIGDRLTRTLSLGRAAPGSLVRRLSRSRSRARRDSDGYAGQLDRRASRRHDGPPMAYYNPQRANTMPLPDEPSHNDRRRASSGDVQPPHNPPRPNPFHRQPTGLSERAVALGGDEDDMDGKINLQDGLDVILNVEVNPKDPAGITTPYRLLVPTLRFTGPLPLPPPLPQDDHSQSDGRSSSPPPRGMDTSRDGAQDNPSVGRNVSGASKKLSKKRSNPNPDRDHDVAPPETLRSSDRDADFGSPAPTPPETRRTSRLGLIGTIKRLGSRRGPRRPMSPHSDVEGEAPYRDRRNGNGDGDGAYADDPDRRSMSAGSFDSYDDRPPPRRRLSEVLGITRGRSYREAPPPVSRGRDQRDPREDSRGSITPRQVDVPRASGGVAAAGGGDPGRGYVGAGRYENDDNDYGSEGSYDSYEDGRWRRRSLRDRLFGR